MAKNSRLMARKGSAMTSDAGRAGSPAFAGKLVQTWRSRWIVLAVVLLSLLGVQIAKTSTSSPYAGVSPPVAAPTSIVNMPPQAAGIVFGDSSAALPFAHPGGLVVAGRDNYDGKGFQTVSERGGTVLMYLDAVIDNSHGRYHSLLNDASQCGPATSRWPGSPKANSYGYLNDFRLGSVLQRKLSCVLQIMISENPQMGGWFADDGGSRSWFPGFDWDTWGQANQHAYRAGAIGLTKIFRRVANRHHLLVMVNGTWGAGSVASSGGGYPDANQSGNALADGGFVENHDGEIKYFGPYACSGQWAAESPVTKGKAINYAMTETAAGLRAFKKSNCYAYVNRQPNYTRAPSWGRFHPTGLPSHVS